MFRSGRWRSDKNKEKAQFKLQFHATQFSEFELDALVVSVIPGDGGKPSATSDKSIVRVGTCRWQSPIYETVKFTRDARTGKVSRKNFRFLVTSCGSSKSGYIGEVCVDLADYADVLKLSTISLPLKNSKSNGILHISIQKCQNNEEKGEEEEMEHSINSTHGIKKPIIEGILNAPRTETSGESKLSSASDITRSSSESSSSLNTPRAVGVTIGNVLQCPSVLSASLPKWRWSSDMEAITDDVAEMDIDKLKAEIVVLTRQVDLSELERQALRKQIVKENKKFQDISKELISVKEECEKMKSCQRKILDEADTRTIIEELNYERDMNSNLRLQLKKTQDSNAELMLAVKELEETMESSRKDVLKCNNMEACDLDQDMINLQSEIDMCRREKDEIEMQMEQLALDYEILKQENHHTCQKLEQSQLEEQLKTQYECCGSSSKLNELESNIKKLQLSIKVLEEENKIQKNNFNGDLEILMKCKVEQEQRAIKAEEDLRKAKWKNAKTAEKLQAELKLVFTKMQSAFDEKESAVLNALAEVSLLRQQKEVNQKEMETELKEMHKRYSELSLKFAEVEGERQQLVMELRNLKTSTPR